MPTRRITGRAIWRRCNSTARRRRGVDRARSHRRRRISPSSGGQSSRSSRPSRLGGYEVRPTGNAVNLEDEMIKVAANQMDYQAATTLYTRSLGLIKTAHRQALASRRAAMDFLKSIAIAASGLARAGRPHARHLREHRQRRFDRADRRAPIRTAARFRPSRPRSTARSTRSSSALGRVHDRSSPNSASSTSRAIRRPTPTATSNIPTSIRWSK